MKRKGDPLQGLLDYQRFARNEGLQRQIDQVLTQYSAAEAEALSDAQLDLSAAGDPYQSLVQRQEGSGHGPRRP